MLQGAYTAGDSFAATFTGGSYPAGNGWVGTLKLIPRDTVGTPIQITCTASGDNHAAEAGATTTAAWGAGPYSWVFWVEQGATVHTVLQGQVDIRPDPRNLVGGADLRTPTQVALDAARTALREWSPLKKRFQIGARSIEFNSHAEIVAHINRLETELLREQGAARGLPVRRKVMVRVGR